MVCQIGDKDDRSAVATGAAGGVGWQNTTGAARQPGRSAASAAAAVGMPSPSPVSSSNRTIFPTSPYCLHSHPLPCPADLPALAAASPQHRAHNLAKYDGRSQAARAQRCQRCRRRWHALSKSRVVLKSYHLPHFPLLPAFPSTALPRRSPSSCGCKSSASRTQRRGARQRRHAAARGRASESRVPAS